MERIMRSQAFSDPSRAQYMNSQKTMEINPRHPIIAELNRQVGFAQDDVDAFALRMYRTMRGALKLESLELEPEVDVPEEEEEDEDEDDEDFDDDDDEEEGGSDEL